MIKKVLTALVLPMVFLGCDKNDDNDNAEKPEFRNRSNAEAFMTIDPAFSTVSAYTLISSSDTIPGYPDFVYGGAPDGQGFSSMTFAQLRSKIRSTK